MSVCFCFCFCVCVCVFFSRGFSRENRRPPWCSVCDLRARRYSTDPRWHVPHFEKMLYDQSQLITAYIEAFQVASCRCCFRRLPCRCCCLCTLQTVPVSRSSISICPTLCVCTHPTLDTANGPGHGLPCLKRYTCLKKVYCSIVLQLSLSSTHLFAPSVRLAWALRI